MAWIETHCKDCINIFGKGYKKVHEWLDAYAKKFNPYTHLEYHRQFRHHEEGIEEIKRKWGFYAGQAAKLHIIRDNEQFVYFNMKTLREDDIDDLYLKAVHFCHKPPDNDRWKTDEDTKIYNQQNHEK
jgi:hypothetical protein